MRNRTYGGVRGRKTKVGRKLLRFPPTRLDVWIQNYFLPSNCSFNAAKASMSPKVVEAA